MGIAIGGGQRLRSEVARRVRVIGPLGMGIGLVTRVTSLPAKVTGQVARVEGAAKEVLRAAR